jgi:hypothetical protein
MNGGKGKDFLRGVKSFRGKEIEVVDTADEIVLAADRENECGRH